jgi:hypothetical protein
VVWIIKEYDDSPELTPLRFAKPKANNWRVTYAQYNKAGSTKKDTTAFAI